MTVFKISSFKKIDTSLVNFCCSFDRYLIKFLLEEGKKAGRPAESKVKIVRTNIYLRFIELYHLLKGEKIVLELIHVENLTMYKEEIFLLSFKKQENYKEFYQKSFLIR